MYGGSLSIPHCPQGCKCSETGVLGLPGVTRQPRSWSLPNCPHGQLADVKLDGSRPLWFWKFQFSGIAVSMSPKPQTSTHVRDKKAWLTFSVPASSADSDARWYRSEILSISSCHSKAGPASRRHLASGGKCRVWGAPQTPRCTGTFKFERYR